MKKNLLASQLSIIALLLISSQSFAQAGYPQSLLNTKQTFSRNAAVAMAEPYRGVATSTGIVPGLFPIQATGASTASVVRAADIFLSTLNTAQLSRSHFAVDDPEWRNWSNVDVGIFARHGVSLEEMSDQQKAAAWNLLSESLSQQGLDKTQRIMRTEQTLLELNGEPIRYGEEKYYFTVMGLPSADEPWGWQLDGHHLVINFFVLGGQVVMTPVFMGGEPVVTDSGKYIGNLIMQQEQDKGLAFMQSLDAAQQARATINGVKTRNNNTAEANQDNLTTDYVGIKASELSSAQKVQLLDLIREYVANLRDPHAVITLDAIGQHIEDTYFSWVGGVVADGVFYYRIHSPVILIEFDHQNPVGTLQKNAPGTPTRDHIHSIVRTPNGNDYGKDLLAQHLATHPH